MDDISHIDDLIYKAQPNEKWLFLKEVNAEESAVYPRGTEPENIFMGQILPLGRNQNRVSLGTPQSDTRQVAKEGFVLSTLSGSYLLN